MNGTIPIGTAVTVYGRPAEVIGHYVNDQGEPCISLRLDEPTTIITMRLASTEFYGVKIIDWRGAQ